MHPRRQLRIGALGAIGAGLCCFTPLLAWTLVLLGLGAAAAWLDWVLLPLLAASLVLLGVGWWRMRRASHAGQSGRPGGPPARGGEPATDALTLITFAGCPNAPRAREALREAGFAFREVRQDDLPPGHPHRGYTSPTILAGDHVLHGMASGEAGCSVAPPDATALRTALEALRQVER